MMELILPLLLVLFAGFMFMNARRQRRQYQQMQQMQRSLTPGDRVMTTSGLHGTVVDTTEDTIHLEIAPGVHTTWVRQAVRERVDLGTETASDADDTLDEATDEPVDDRPKADGR